MHCYSFDEEVIYLELQQHLKTIGIDVTSQVKMEKSIAEQELEINLNFTLSKIIDKEKTLKPLFGEYNTEIEKLGNTCYINSAI